MYKILKEIGRDLNKDVFIDNVIKCLPPNNRDTLGKWLYGTPKTCKEGNGYQCAANNHTDLSRQVSYLGASLKSS